MASMLLVFFLLLIPLAAVEAKTERSNLISFGSSLSPSSGFNHSWFSPSGLIAFGFYPKSNGFAVGIWLVGKTNNTIVWTANPDDPPVSPNSTVEFTTNGTLLLRTDNGTDKTIAEPDDSSASAASASMLDSGNFVIYGNDSTLIWESFDYPTDTILGGQTLSSGHELQDSSGRHLLRMQSDGNLVAYPAESTFDKLAAYWASETNSPESIVLNLSSNGSLYLANDTSTVLELANGSLFLEENNSTIYRATLDDDGIFRLYSHRLGIQTVKWSLLQDRCLVHGSCGFNSYCSSNIGNEVDCYCYPGFVFVDSRERTLGCYRNFTEDPCGTKTWSNVTRLENLRWGDTSYSVASMKEENCGKSCEEDCNCVAALFFDGICRKQKFPLRYGVRKSNNSATAFFKIMGVLNVTTPDPGDMPLLPSATVVTENRRGLISVLSISLGSIAFLCFGIAVSSFLVYKHRVHRYKQLSENAKLGLNEDFILRSFSYNDLVQATKGFTNELGKGSHGTVYRGTLPGVPEKMVAVKRLENVLEEAEREFQSEVTAIGRTNHRNLVRLIGFCVEGSRKLLVYEYMSNGSLADHVFKDGRHPSWRDRIRIALDIARGILYLHEECEDCIIHCNIKPQNILMDEGFTAKISDFGLAKLLMPNYVRSSIEGVGGGAGGRSYLAPEWEQRAMISVKADIYSFGIVLLEVMCCRSNIEVNVSNADEIILSSWVYKCFLAGKFFELVQDEDVVLNTLVRMVKVGLWCIQDDPGLRPSMKKVILMLEGTMDIPMPPNPSNLSDRSGSPNYSVIREGIPRSVSSLNISRK